MIAGRMPHLEAFLGTAVQFTQARSVFPSLTRVATTSLSTGTWPATHGIVSNAFHHPDVIAGRALNTGEPADLMALTRAEGHCACALGIGAHLAAHGRRMGSIHCGSAGSAFLLNPAAADGGHWTYTPHGAAASLTPDAVHRADALVGPAPAPDLPRFRWVEHAGKVFQALALGDDQPDLSVLWLPEPDTSGHYRTLGSTDTAAAMRIADAVFGHVLDAVDQTPDGARTAVIALSDHGQIGTHQLWNMSEAATADGLNLAEEPGAEPPLALTTGISGEIRTLRNDPGPIRDAAQWLMSRDEIGLVFARDGLVDTLPGTLPLSAALLDHPRAAELVYVTRCTDTHDKDGLPGQAIFTGGGVPVGGGMHGGLHPVEWSTLLAIRAPEALPGTAETPAALVDIAPTIAALMGLPPIGTGRVLPLEPQKDGDMREERLTASHAGFSQWLSRRSVGANVYLEAGGRS